MANPAIHLLSSFNQNQRGDSAVQALWQRGDLSFSFSATLRDQVYDNSARQAQLPQSPQRPPETAPRDDAAGSRQPSASPTRPATNDVQREPVRENPAGPTENGSASDTGKTVETKENSQPGRDDGGKSDENKDASSAEPTTAAEDAAEKAESSPPSPESLLLASGMVLQPSQPATLAALIAQIADRLQQALPSGKNGLPSPAAENIDLTDAEATVEGDETALLELGAGAAKRKGVLPPADFAKGHAGGEKAAGQEKNALLSEPIIAALRGQPQTTAARTPSFADIPVAAASTTSSLQSELPAGALQAAGYNPGLRTEQAATQLQVHTPAGQRVWAEDVGSKLVWMIGRNESKAELVLTPPNLGKLGVSIHSSGDQTSAHFVAATPAAREALEQAMPRLREMLQQAGINLGQTEVSTSGEQRSGEERGQARGWTDSDGAQHDSVAEETLHVATPGPRWTSYGNGMVDTFA